MATLAQVPLAVNQECVLGVLEEDGVAWYPAMIRERAGSRLWIESASDTVEALEEQLGAEIAVDVWRAGDARYTMRTILAVAEPRPMPRLLVNVIDADRIQRRQFFRVPVMLNVSEVRVMCPEGDERQLTMNIYDISAGGLGARSTVRLSADSDAAVSIGCELSLVLRLPSEMEALRLRARVVRVGDERPAAVAGSHFEFGAAFVDLTPPVQERLIHAVLQVQHLHAQRGVL